MKYVLDSCVGLDSDKPIQTRDDYNRGVHELLSPDYLLIEVAHAFARAERREIIHKGTVLGASQYPRDRDRLKLDRSFVEAEKQMKKSPRIARIG
jgi:hypothetical protein